uniref:Integrase, catalytic region, zinc finger, CCHC-type, peptidase aspartic, catalytic n=1 Tax=Tanacetum cinerariifolium TaxID=118510 RepID=A0A6L2LGY7_TANCI|nr:integrase, catalytic region, zinc finger, CCHC-type, peptidase aspartic, catalytic [Tanacetum cinerariifolium]
MLNKENYVPWSSCLLWYAKSRPNGKLFNNSILNGPYVRLIIPEPRDANREITVTETFYLQTDDELSDMELKQIEADDQAIQTILLDLPEDIYAAFDSCETAQEIWLRVQQMMKGSDIGIQEKKAKLFNEWEMFPSNKGESIESYYHRFLKLMNDLKRNNHFPEKIASNLKFLNNLQPEWSQHKEVDELKAERLAKTQDPLVLMANSNNPYAFPAPHQDQSSFNQNYLQQPMLNPEDITDPTTAMNMALALMAKAFKLNYSTPTNNNQRISSNLRNRQIAQSKEYDLMAAEADLDEIKDVNANCILMANLQQASTLGTQTESAPVYDSDRSAEEAAKFVGDFKSLANEADASLAKYKALELEIERLLKAVVSQDIMIIVQNESVVDKTETIRPQLRSNTKHDRVPSASKSSRSKNKEAEVEEHHRNLLLSKNNKHISSACKIADSSKSNSHSDCAMVIQICLWCIDSGCSKHMTGNLKLLINFVWKFMGNVRFENDHVAAILGFGDLQWGNILITRVYFIEGLGHNLSSVGQFYDSDLEVAFRRDACFVET